MFSANNLSIIFLSVIHIYEESVNYMKDNI